MREKIKELRAKGKSYNQIAKEVGCSKSTAYYHCVKKHRERRSEQKAEYRKTPNGVLSHKINQFQHRELYKKQRDFKRRKKPGKSLLKNKMGHNFNIIDLKNKIGNKPVCFLTGRKIDLGKPSDYHLDHIIPSKIRVDNSLGNCAITTRNANHAKHDMTLGEFIELCIDVCKNFGYTVRKDNQIGD